MHIVFAEMKGFYSFTYCQFPQDKDDIFYRKKMKKTTIKTLLRNIMQTFQTRTRNSTFLLTIKCILILPMTAFVWSENSLKLFTPLAKLLFLMQECTACLRYDECVDVWCLQSDKHWIRFVFCALGSLKGFCLCCLQMTHCAEDLKVCTAIRSLKGTENLIFIIFFISFTPVSCPFIPSAHNSVTRRGDFICLLVLSFCG